MFLPLWPHQLLHCPSRRTGGSGTRSRGPTARPGQAKPGTASVIAARAICARMPGRSSRQGVRS
eukprot:6240398-Alexandrium_andersonii.AAC.1